jgi:hypothetical protein
MNERIKAEKRNFVAIFCYFATLALRKSWKSFFHVSVNYIFQQKFATF